MANQPYTLDGMAPRRRPIDAVAVPLARFARHEAAGGVVLLLAAVSALVLANSPLRDVFHEFWTGTRIRLSVGTWVFPPGDYAGTLEWWVNDALMAVFFFVIGLELKREFLAGELREPRKAALPLIGAVGGIAAPGLIYGAFTWEGAALRGWAIPTATDIAFALGVLALLGRRVPAGLRVFLVTLAIADDLGALIIIATFYTSGESLSLPALGFAVATVGFMGCLNVLGVRLWWVYGIMGLVLWYFVLRSGVHPTIAGVMGALTIPVRTRIDGAEFTRQARRLCEDFDRAGPRTAGADRMVVTNPVQQGVLLTIEQLTERAQTPLQRLEAAMVPLSAFFVVPVFALANAGVSVGDVLGPSLRDGAAWGIVAGLVVGKAVGILGTSFLAVWFGVSVLPTGVTWRHMLGASLLGGIGFTMSLFIADLAFGSSERLEIAKLAVLSGSAIAAALATLVLLTGRSNRAAAAHPAGRR